MPHCIMLLLWLKCHATSLSKTELEINIVQIWVSPKRLIAQNRNGLEKQWCCARAFGSWNDPKWSKKALKSMPFMIQYTIQSVHGVSRKNCRICAGMCSDLCSNVLGANAHFPRSMTLIWWCHSSVEWANLFPKSWKVFSGSFFEIPFWLPLAEPLSFLMLQSGYMQCPSGYSKPGLNISQFCLRK